MIKKVLTTITLLAVAFVATAQSLTNLVYLAEIQPTETSVSLTFDYAGLNTGDRIEWQLFLALPDGSPDFGSGRNIAYEAPIDPGAASGTETITFGVFGTPVDGEIFTWTGVIKFADGTEGGYNNTGNLVEISSTASANDFATADSVSIYPNPVADVLNVKLKNTKIESVSIYDMLGKKVKSVDNMNQFNAGVDVSQLKQGLYILVLNNKTNVKFSKK